MPSLGVTGGIATGKTTVSTVLARSLNAEVFDSDRAAHALLAEDRKVLTAVQQQFGTDVFAQDGTIDRAALRQIVFAEEARRKQLEQILHPKIRAAWLKRIEERRVSENEGWLLVDIPLLFETNAESYFDAILVVACSPAVQRWRMHEHRRLSERTAEKMMAAQFDLAIKIQNAHHVIWNDGALHHATVQAELLATHLKHHHG